MININEKIEGEFYTIQYENSILEIKLIDPLFNVYVIKKFKFIEYTEFEDIIASKLKKFALNNNISLLCDDREHHEKINLFLQKIGFKITKKKVFYEKFLDNHIFDDEDIFEYKSISEIGEEKFIEVFSEATEGDTERGDVEASIYYKSIKDDANETFDPNKWKVVILKDIIGMIMPQVFWDLPQEGSVFNIGVIPKYRNKGYGKILHSKCLDLLKNDGVKRYIGSTLEENYSMNKVFKKNGCSKIMTRFFYKLN